MSVQSADELAASCKRLQEVARTITEGPMKDLLKRCMDAAESFGRAWSGSFLGYHASMYYRGFEPVPLGDEFDGDWGRYSENWRQFSHDDVWRALVVWSNLSDLSSIDEAVSIARNVLKDTKIDIIATLDVVASLEGDPRIAAVRNEVSAAEPLTREKLVRQFLPREHRSRDDTAVRGGVVVPAHVAFRAMAMEATGVALCANKVADLATQAERYLRKKSRIVGFARSPGDAGSSSGDNTLGEQPADEEPSLKRKEDIIVAKPSRLLRK